MSRECPGCGAATAPEARFCRRCGVPLKTAGGHDTNPTFSPVAQTVPLADEGRATDGLAAEESQRIGEGTSRIKRTEMEEMLRRVAREHAGDASASHPLAQADGSGQIASADGSGQAAATVSATSALKTPGDGAPHAQAKSNTRSSARWRLLAAILLSVTLAAGLLAFIYSRRSKASDAGGPTAVPVSVETQPAAAGGDVPQGEPLTVETPHEANASSPAPPARARDAEADAHPPATKEAPIASAISTAPPAPTPDAGLATTPPPTALSAADHYQRGVQLWERDRRAALEEFRAAVPGVSDAYYYLGSEYYSEGRDVKTLSDGELKAALNYFLRATSGPHSSQASRAAQLLGKEYERRKKKQSRP